MEKIYCPICKSNDNSDLISVNNRLQEKDNVIYNIVKCICGLVYLNPRPPEAEINRYYLSDDYDPHRIKQYSITDLAYRAVQKLALNFKFYKIRKYFRSGNLLDIGCGNGEFGEFMNSKGFNVVIQDNFSNYKGDLEFHKDLESIKSKFNIISLWHVLEHIHNLDRLFNFLNHSLHKNGILVIAVPNHDAFERKYFTDKWAPYDAPRHLYHFDDVSLKGLLKKYGYNIVHKNIMLHDSFYNVMLSIRKYNFKNLVKFLKIIFLCILNPIINGTKNSSTIMVICKKIS